MTKKIDNNVFFVPFSKPFVPSNAKKYLNTVLTSGKLSGDHEFTRKCNWLLENLLNAKKVLLTTSGTHALEMAAMLLNISKGDEVIMPSYTFSSTANAFILRGARIVFVDIRPDTMNINEKLIQKAISRKTKAIVAVHYGGIGCEMDEILFLKYKYNLFLVEDAAQGLMAKYNNQMLGTIGDMGCISFHETKNYQCGEGGAIVLNNSKFIKSAEILREKGTNRSRFFRGEIDKYSWINIGSSYLPSDLNAALLLAQLEMADKINLNRLKSWNYYYQHLMDLKNKGHLELPYIPPHCKHNAHIFYIKVKNVSVRSKLIIYLKKHNINSFYHYLPLHNSIAGKRFGKFSGEDIFTTKESARLLRLPLYFNMPLTAIEHTCDTIHKYFI